MRTWLLAFFLALAPAVELASGAVRILLPTPLEHYRTYRADPAALAMIGSLGPAQNPQQLQRMIALGLSQRKHELLELLIHQSQVLDVLPAQSRDALLPVVHDALLAFLDGLAEDRLAERLAAMVQLPPDTPRGEKILLFTSKIPTLQKVGQIIARFDGVPPDIQQSLATLENGVSTMTRDELVAYIEQEVGRETLERYRIRFEGEILAEASVGAVIRGTFFPPGADVPRQMVAKVVKPYALDGLPREMAIIDGLIDLAEQNAAFYEIEDVNVRDFFADVRGNLEDEIRITDEQAHFRRAYEYYRNRRGVAVPEVYPFSTEGVTFMEFLQVEKISDAFPGEPKKRAKLARRLLRFMSYETLFSRTDTAIFHGDPHAGNVMRVTDDPRDPYRLALLDWGLLGEFPRAQRLRLVQLSLALSQGNRKKFMRNVGALLRDGIPEDPARQAGIERLLGEVKATGVKGTFATFGALLERLLAAGYGVDANMSLFIKSQLTLEGIFRELDPTLDQDRFLRSKTTRQVIREFPKRMLLLPAWNYRGYRSLLSNGDVVSDIVH